MGCLNEGLRPSKRQWSEPPTLCPWGGGGGGHAPLPAEDSLGPTSSAGAPSITPTRPTVGGEEGEEDHKRYPRAAISMPKDRAILTHNANSWKAGPLKVLHQPGLLWELCVRVREQIVQTQKVS